MLATTRSGWLIPIADFKTCEPVPHPGAFSRPSTSSPKPKNARLVLAGPSVCEGNRLNDGLSESPSDDIPEFPSGSAEDARDESDGLELASLANVTRAAETEEGGGGLLALWTLPNAPTLLEEVDEPLPESTALPGLEFEPNVI